LARTVHSCCGTRPFILPCRDRVRGLRVTTNHAIPDSQRREVAFMRRRTKARRQNRQKTKLGLPDFGACQIGSACESPVTRIAAQLPTFHR
jgi:hypothetical protein